MQCVFLFLKNCKVYLKFFKIGLDFLEKGIFSKKMPLYFIRESSESMMRVEVGSWTSAQLIPL